MSVSSSARLRVTGIDIAAFRTQSEAEMVSLVGSIARGRRVLLFGDGVEFRERSTRAMRVGYGTLGCDRSTRVDVIALDDIEAWASVAVLAPTDMRAARCLVEFSPRRDPVSVLLSLSGAIAAAILGNGFVESDLLFGTDLPTDPTSLRARLSADGDWQSFAQGSAAVVARIPGLESWATLADKGERRWP